MGGSNRTFADPRLAILPAPPAIGARRTSADVAAANDAATAARVGARRPRRASALVGSAAPPTPGPKTLLGGSY